MRSAVKLGLGVAVGVITMALLAVEAYSALSVCAPAMPSADRPLTLWNSATASAVAVPNLPSMVAVK